MRWAGSDLSSLNINVSFWLVWRPGGLELVEKALQERWRQPFVSQSWVWEGPAEGLLGSPGAPESPQGLGRHLSLVWVSAAGLLQSSVGAAGLGFFNIDWGFFLDGSPKL